MDVAAELEFYQWTCFLGRIFLVFPVQAFGVHSVEHSFIGRVLLFLFFEDFCRFLLVDRVTVQYSSLSKKAFRVFTLQKMLVFILRTGNGSQLRMLEIEAETECEFCETDQ